MDAVNFIKERTRMCKSFGDKCEKCSAFNACEDELYSCAVDVESPMNAEDQIAMVETWSKENPHKTRQSIFLEQYPEAALDALGVIPICPLKLMKNHENSNRICTTTIKSCDVCKQKFWSEEVD